jgi:hypothetical protein
LNSDDVFTSVSRERVSRFPNRSRGGGGANQDPATPIPGGVNVAGGGWSCIDTVVEALAGPTRTAVETPRTARNRIEPPLMSSSILDDLDIVFCTPVLQGSLGGFSLECIPLAQTAFRRQEFFAARVGTPVAKEAFDRRVSIGQFLFGEAQREVAPQIKVILVRYSNVSADVSRSSGTSSSSGFSSDIQ